MAWTLLAEDVLDVAGDLLDSGTFTATKNLAFTVYLIPDGTIHAYGYFNNDGTTTGDYARRGSINGGAEIVVAPDNEMNFTEQVDQTIYSEFKANNLDGAEKQILCHVVESSTTGAGNAPSRIVWAFKWVTSDQITSIQIKNNLSGTSNFDVGSALCVYGTD